MHGYVDYSEFLDGITGLLGCYYVAVAGMNVVAAYWLWRTGRAQTLLRARAVRLTTSHLWLSAAALFALMAMAAASGDPARLQLIMMPALVKDALNRALSPTSFILGTTLVLTILYAARSFFVRPTVAWGILNLASLFLGLSLTDPHFARIVARPDNVPIVGLVFMLGYFTWLGAAQAVKNDQRHQRGEPPLEALDQEQVLVWPDLVYIELICMVAVTALLIVWSIVLKAPLEPPANAVITPNPSKAPWYFLGLQEMLKYFDPWMAGVVIPGLILFGLSALPYLDVNKAGNGYYTISERRFAYVSFQFGFLVLWTAVILMGTFMRGPNWSFFGLYEQWDPHKVENLYNINLSDYFWIWWLGTGRPASPEGAGAVTRLIYVLFRESPGIIMLSTYFVVLPPLLAKCTAFFGNLYRSMGFTRYAVMMLVMLVMLLLPIKMIACWTFNLMYFVAMPEYSLSL